MNSFLDQRLPIGAEFEELTISFFKDLDLEVINTASLKLEIQKQNDNNFWKNDSGKKFQELIMLRWLPDLLIIDGKNMKSIFMDTKVMFTPIYFQKLPNQIEKQHGKKVEFQDIGDIEREAYKSYRYWQQSGAKVATLLLCTFNSKFLMCENIEELEVLHEDIIDRNAQSSGSTTPRVNINLKKIPTLSNFLQNTFGISPSNHHIEKYEKILKEKYNYIGAPNWIYQNQVNAIHSKIEKIVDRPIKIKKIG